MKKIIRICLVSVVFALMIVLSGCESRELVRISVLNEPTKVIYFVGDSELNLDGGELTLHYSNGDIEVISMNESGATFTPLDSSSAKTQTITITFKGKSTSFDIEIFPTQYFPSLTPLIETLQTITFDIDNFSLTNEQFESANEAHSFYNSLTSEEKALIVEYKDLINSSKFLADYYEFLVNNAQVLNALHSYKTNLTYDLALEFPFNLSLDSFSLESKYTQLKDLPLPCENLTTIGDILFKLFTNEQEFNLAKETVQNALNCYIGFSKLSSPAPYGNKIIQNTQISQAITNIKSLSNTQIENALNLLTNWNNHYIETLYEFLYYTHNENINAQEIKSLNEKVKIEIFATLDSQFELIILSQELIAEYDYMNFICVYELVKMSVEIIENDYANFTVIQAFYNDFIIDLDVDLDYDGEADENITYFTYVEHNAIEQLIFIYLIAGSLTEDEEFMNSLNALIDIIVNSFLNSNYVLSEQFKLDIEALIEDVNSMSLSMQFNFYSAQQGYYATYADIYYAQNLNANQYQVYDSLMIAIYEYFYFQFGYSENENMFLEKMLITINQYNQLQNTQSFDEILLNQYTKYKDFYLNLKAIKDNEQYMQSIQNLISQFDLTHQSYSMQIIYFDSTLLMINFPILKQLVDEIYQTQNEEFISLFENYAIFGSTMLEAYTTFNEAYLNITKDFTQNSLAFSDKIVQISSKVLPDLKSTSDIWDITDKSNYNGDYNADMQQLLTLFNTLNAEEKSQVICEHNMFIDLLFNDYISQFLSPDEITVFSLLLESAFAHALYLSPKHPTNTTLDSFNQAIENCIQLYEVLQDKTDFDTHLQQLYNFYISLKS